MKFEKHKSNKRTFEEIKSLLLYESKSLSNKLKNLENNKEIGDKKINILNKNILWN